MRPCRTFLLNRERAVDYLNMLERLYIFDGFAGWEPEVLRLFPTHWHCCCCWPLNALELWVCIAILYRQEGPLLVSVQRRLPHST